MEIQKTEYFDFLDDSDLNTKESYNTMLLFCPECKHFFFSKACGGRNVFESHAIFHPTDGNCVIAYCHFTDEEMYSHLNCDCKNLTRIKYKKDLENIFEKLSNQQGRQ